MAEISASPETYDKYNIGGDFHRTQENMRAICDAKKRIGSRVLRLLRFDTTVNAHSIEVETLEGKVILSGTVTSSAERNVAETLAGRVPGVTAVDSRLIIERPR